ncbi:patatin-like phospholipase domain-containing protein 7 isoform X2 [Ruditapes philippinarum]|uniref:patatin-like phospholipase domain-containing protein 7 isoform X2 n=1 Tax=Ruditapes philippinarum TaxID=129788 RepID=UPI00295A7386|nr:patatin-like phospholipase domain-containing protein 7 isoform X2 [Ruditapes philippinarum]
MSKTSLDELAENLKGKISDIEEEIKRQVAERLSKYDLTLSIVVAVSVAIITTLVIVVFGLWKLKKRAAQQSQSGTHKKYRFRKRDKVLFYGRKMLRKVSSFSRNTINAAGLGQGKGRAELNKKEIMMLARKFSKILRLKKDPSQPTLQVKGPPKSFFEADGADMEEDHRIPSEVLYMLRSVRVFGHFEKPLFLELCKHMESKFVPAGSYLFRVGDEDNCIYVVQSGKINVYITEGGSEYLVKEVDTGDSIHSLLSILDFITGKPQPYKTVSARAVVDTTILKLPATAFQSLFERFPESLVRVVQVIMVRLQRVTFTALHNYLGLSSELINRRNSVDLKTLSIHAIASQTPLYKRHSSQAGISESENEKHEATGKVQAPSVSSVADESDNDTRITDFDAACLRARVTDASKTVLRQVSDDGMSGSPQGPRMKIKRPSEPFISESGETFKDEDILDMAKADLVKILKLKDESLLEDRVHLHTYRGGVNLMKQGDQEASILFVVSGQLNVLQHYVGEVSKEVKLFSAQPGEIVGALAVLTGEPSFFTIRSKYETRVVVISKKDFYLIMREQPSVVLNVASTTLIRLTPFVRQIDFALDWMMIEAGRALFRQGDHSDSIYIVLTGRLRTVITNAGNKKEMVGEYGRGELVGIVEVLTQQERVTTGIAVRDTELAKLPSELLNVIKRKFPQVVTRLIHLLGQRIIGSMRSKDSLQISETMQGVDARGSVNNLATVAILPASSDVPLTNFTLELQHAVKAIGPVTRFTSDIVKRWLGAGAFDRAYDDVQSNVNEFRLFSWLGQQEDLHRVILYQCDYTMTKWTKMCIRQSDCILIVGIAGTDPKVGELEQQMETIDVRAQKELVLLHQEDADYPQGTVEWLNARGWCSSHHHIRCPKRVFSKRSIAKMTQVYEELSKTKADRMSDMSRLARFLTGTSVGLVLGGGGARGLSHIGIIRAMIEAKIPIDIVGGTSIGSFMGALWCEEVNHTRFIQRAREWSMKMTSIASKIFDLTYPVASMFTGSSFNEGIESTFKDRQIEDLWIPYFCISTDLNMSQMRVHTHGSLWRYVRASMTLAGYLPPLCDPIDGHLLLDGGYVNNLPADVMRSFGAQSIFAVDVGSIDSTELTNYGDKLSGWWLLWKRWNPWAAPVRVPDMQEIQSRLAYVSCIRQLELVKNSDYCEYIRPPIDKYGTLQFGSFDEIMDVGYNHGKTMLTGWEKGGLISKLFQDKKCLERKHLPSRSSDPDVGHAPRLTYFTDLAELVSKIDEPTSSVSIYDNDDDDEVSDSYDEEEVLVSDINQHASGPPDKSIAGIQSVQFHLPEEDYHDDEAEDQGDDGDDEGDDDDDDDQYVTESDGEEEDNLTSLATKFKMSPSTEKFGLPRRLSGYLKK